MLPNKMRKSIAFTALVLMCTYVTAQADSTKISKVLKHSQVGRKSVISADDTATTSYACPGNFTYSSSTLPTITIDGTSVSLTQYGTSCNGSNNYALYFDTAVIDGNQNLWCNYIGTPPNTQSTGCTVSYKLPGYTASVAGSSSCTTTSIAGNECWTSTADNPPPSPICYAGTALACPFTIKSSSGTVINSSCPDYFTSPLNTDGFTESSTNTCPDNNCQFWNVIPTYYGYGTSATDLTLTSLSCYYYGTTGNDPMLYSYSNTTEETTTEETITLTNGASYCSAFSNPSYCEFTATSSTSTS